MRRVLREVKEGTFKTCEGGVPVAVLREVKEKTRGHVTFSYDSTPLLRAVWLESLPVFLCGGIVVGFITCGSTAKNEENSIGRRKD